MGKAFWGVGSAAVKQSRRKANMAAQGDGKFDPWGWPQDPSKPKKKKQQMDYCASGKNDWEQIDLIY